MAEKRYRGVEDPGRKCWEDDHKTGVAGEKPHRGKLQHPTVNIKHKNQGKPVIKMTRLDVGGLGLKRKL